MGLDMYLTGDKYAPSFGDTPREVVDGYEVESQRLKLAYWRKHWALHNYIEAHYYSEGPTTALGSGDLRDIAKAIEDGKLVDPDDLDIMPSYRNIYAHYREPEQVRETVDALRKAADWVDGEGSSRHVYLHTTILFGIPNKLPATKEKKDDTMTTSLGAKIKRHRQEKGYSLDKLAELTDSSKSYIWELENRDERKPSGEKLTRIAQALEVTTDCLLDESENPGDAVLKESFFRKFSKLAPDDQAKINQMIDMWGKKH